MNTLRELCTAIDAHYAAELTMLDDAVVGDAQDLCDSTKDIVSFIDALQDMVNCFDLSDSPEHVDYETWLKAKAIADSEPGAPALESESVNPYAWRPEWNDIAMREGWAINGRKIQRDDEGPLDSDDEVIAHVRKIAEAGSMMHRAAIDQHDIDIFIAEPRFETSAGRFSLSNLLAANAEDSALCDWLRSAAIGERFGGGAGESIIRIA